MNEHLWMPVLNISLFLVTSKKLKGARPHMLYAQHFLQRAGSLEFLTIRHDGLGGNDDA